MTREITEAMKKEIFKLITVPGVEIEEIAEKLNLDYDTVMNVLSEEYVKYNLNDGRRLCCR